MVVPCRDVAAACPPLDCELLAAVCGHSKSMHAIATNYGCDVVALEELCRRGIEARTPSCKAGSELKRLLAGWPFYIVATPTCPCTSRAAEMDAKGCEWCDENLDTIVGWLREQANARGLPFLDAVGKMLVRRAIRNARKVSDGNP